MSEEAGYSYYNAVIRFFMEYNYLDSKFQGQADKGNGVRFCGNKIAN